VTKDNPNLGPSFVDAPRTAVLPAGGSPVVLLPDKLPEALMDELPEPVENKRGEPEEPVTLFATAAPAATAPPSIAGNMNNPLGSL